MKKKILYIDQVYNKAIPLIENKIKKHYIENDYILINSVKNWL